MKPLSWTNKVSYALGDTASNLLFQLTLIYLLFFYTDVLGLSPALAGLVFVIVRVWDALSNPIMGYLMDHTSSKHGTARVYLRYGPLPLALATVLVFFVPGFDASGTFFYALGTYILWSLLYTLVNLPYASMTAQLSDDPQERTSITSVRMIGMLVGVVVVSVATEPITTAFSDPTQGYLAAAILYSCLALGLFVTCYWGTRRLPLVQAPAARYRIRDVGGVLVKNPPALLVSGTFFLGSCAEYVRQSSVVYYVTYNMGDASLVPVFLGLVVLAMVAGNLLIPALTNWLDKKGTYIAGVTLACAASLVFQFVPADQTVLVLILAVISSLGFSVVSTMGWSMLPDTVEYGEWKTGVRSEGILYAFFGFSQKLATAVGGGVVALVLSTTGYAAQSPQQTPLALQGIVSTLGVLPLGFLLLSLGLVSFYRLSRSEFGAVKTQLGR